MQETNWPCRSSWCCQLGLNLSSRNSPLKALTVHKSLISQLLDLFDLMHFSLNHPALLFLKPQLVFLLASLFLHPVTVINRYLFCLSGRR